MLSWFNATEFQRFGEELAVLLIEGKAAPGEDNRHFRRKSKARGSEPAPDILRYLVMRITAFEARKGANFYKKAKFANAFKWKLIEAGYEARFADTLVKELVIHFR